MIEKIVIRELLKSFRYIKTNHAEISNYDIQQLLPSLHQSYKSLVTYWPATSMRRFMPNFNFIKRSKNAIISCQSASLKFLLATKTPFNSSNSWSSKAINIHNVILKTHHQIPYNFKSNWWLKHFASPNQNIANQKKSLNRFREETGIITDRISIEVLKPEQHLVYNWSCNTSTSTKFLKGNKDQPNVFPYSQ